MCAMGSGTKISQAEILTIIKTLETVLKSLLGVTDVTITIDLPADEESTDEVSLQSSSEARPGRETG